MKRNHLPIKLSLILFILIVGAMSSLILDMGEGSKIEDEEIDFPTIKGYYCEGDLDYDYGENPFRITYADPTEINDMIWDHANRTIYIACEYGILIKDLETGKYDVISEWDGIEFTAEWKKTYIDDIEMDWVNGRLFAISREIDKIYQIDVETRKVQREYEFDMGINLLKMGHYRKMAYDHSRDVLYIGKDTGLLVFHLNTGEIQFYDLYNFDIGIDFFQETIDGFELVTRGFFTISDLVFHTGTDKLFISTTIGLYEFSVDTGQIKNFTEERGLDSEIRDLMLVEDTLYIGSVNLISFDVRTRDVKLYPRVCDDEKNLSVFSMGFDHESRIIYTCMISWPPDIFRIVTFNAETAQYGILNGPMDPFDLSMVYGDEPLRRVNKVVYPDPESGLVYLGRGSWETMGYEWKIEYHYDGELDIKRMKDGDYQYHLREFRFINASSRKSNRFNGIHTYTIGMGPSRSGYLFYTYDTDNGMIGNSTICDLNMIPHNPDDEILIHRNTGKVFIKEGRGLDRIFIYSVDGALENVLHFDPESHDICNIMNDIFLVKDDLYISVYNGIYRYCISNGTFEEILFNGIGNVKNEEIKHTVTSMDDMVIIRSDEGLSVYDPSTWIINRFSPDRCYITDYCIGNGSVIFSTSDNVYEYVVENGTLNKIADGNLSGNRFEQVEYDGKNDLLYMLENGSLAVYDPMNDNFTWIDLDINISRIWVNENGSGLIFKEYIRLSDSRYHFYIHDTGEVLPFEDLSGVGKISYHKGTDSNIFSYRLGASNTDFASTKGVMNGFPETSTINSFCMDHYKDLFFAITGPISGHFSYSSEYPNGLIIYDMVNGTFINLSRYHGLPSQKNHLIRIDEARGSLHILGEHFYAVLPIDDIDEDCRINDVPTLYVMNISIGSEAEVFGHSPDLTISYAAAGGGAGLLALLGIAVYLIEPMRIRLFQVLVNPLFSRYKGDVALHNKRREIILNMISENPGINFSELKKALGYNNGSLAHHLNYLERGGLIRSNISGIRKNFYTFDQRITNKRDEPTERQISIIHLIRSEPGISQREISRRLDDGASTINYNVKKLVKDGWIRVIKHNGRSLYYPTRTDKIKITR